MLKYKILIEENTITVDFEKDHIHDELTVDDYHIIENEIKNQISDFEDFMHDYETIYELVYIRYSFWFTNRRFYESL